MYFFRIKETVTMNKIRPWLYIGKYRDTLNEILLAQYQIGALLQLVEPVEHQGLHSLYLAIGDFAPIPHDRLRQGIAFVRLEKQQGQRVLIACGAGINRSSAFALAALKEEENLDLLTAFRRVKQNHAEALPHAPVWESLCAYYQEAIPHERLLEG